MYIKEDKLRYREGGDWGAGCYRVSEQENVADEIMGVFINNIS